MLSSPVAGLTVVCARKPMPNSQQYGMLKLQEGFRLLARHNCSRNVPDFGSGKSGIRPFFGNPAKSGSGQNFDRMWPDLGQLSHMVILLTTATSTGTSTGIFHLYE